MSQQIFKNSYFSTEGELTYCGEIDIYENTTDNYKVEVKNNTKVNSNMTIGTPDQVVAMYNYLFSANIDMIDRNRFLYKTLNELQNSGIEGKGTVVKFVKENAFCDLHPSLMQTTLLMTQNIQDIAAERERILIRLKEKLQA